MRIGKHSESTCNSKVTAFGFRTACALINEQFVSIQNFSQA